MINPSQSESLIEVNGKTVFNPTERATNLVYRWFQDKKGTGHGTRRRLSFSLGQYTTVFQKEEYAIKACAVENIKRNYTRRNRNIYIPSDNQTAIKALGNHQITSKLAWDCHQSLIQLARHN
jgi:hypothetical protein